MPVPVSPGFPWCQSRFPRDGSRGNRTNSRPSSSPFSQARLSLYPGWVSSPSRVDRADVTTSIIREYGVRRNAVEIIFFAFGWPQGRLAQSAALRRTSSHHIRIAGLCSPCARPPFSPPDTFSPQKQKGTCTFSPLTPFLRPKALRYCARQQLGVRFPSAKKLFPRSRVAGLGVDRLRR